MSADMNQENANVIDDMKENRKAVRKKRSPFSIVIELLIYAFIVFFCLYIFLTYIMERTVVSGESMEDTLHHNESLLVNKLSYRFGDPERYDIIVFQPKGQNVDEYYVKRIYGLPGETIYIDKNSIYVNGEKVDDPYAKDAMDDDLIEIGTPDKPYKLKENEYYVLGDHRSVSMDSRYSPESDEDAPGPVKRENIVGKVFIRIWPLNKFGTP